MRDRNHKSGELKFSPDGVPYEEVTTFTERYVDGEWINGPKTITKVSVEEAYGLRKEITFSMILTKTIDSEDSVEPITVYFRQDMKASVLPEERLKWFYISQSKRSGLLMTHDMRQEIGDYAGITAPLGIQGEERVKVVKLKTKKISEREKNELLAKKVCIGIFDKDFGQQV